eukprot:CAMPEP_0117620494 /NCGR_PEP_ID=MMETSP0784-20121206/87156_1 /TAXON_ID=39447 /ORGANISM="" /LENGTH=126 /DNA_ID=CAMNT_0005424407 /DNA_START=90 /DNA_END=467 /DNA_ORIENTATION=+
MEPHALYVVTVDSQYRCPYCVLRFACSADIQFRELSAVEAGHFLAAQPNAKHAVDAEAMCTLPRCTSERSSEADWRSEDGCADGDLGMRCLGHGATGLSATAWGGAHAAESSGGSILQALLSRFGC